MTELYYGNMIHPISLEILGPILKANLSPYLKIVYSILKALETNKIKFRLNQFNRNMQLILTRHIVKNQLLKEEFDKYNLFFSILDEIGLDEILEYSDNTKYQELINLKFGSIKSFQLLMKEFNSIVIQKVKSNSQSGLFFYEIKLNSGRSNDNTLKELIETPWIEVDQTKLDVGDQKKEPQYVQIYDKVEIYSAFLITKTEYNWFLVPRILHPFQTQRNALNNLLYYPSDHLRYFIKLFENSEKSALKWLNFIPKSLSENEWKFLTSLNYKNTIEQRDFIQKALRTPEFMFLEGPPGSGKTRTICELIYQLVRTGSRVMLVASTHVAVDNVLDAIAKEKNTGIIPIRIGLEKEISLESRKYSIEKQIHTFCQNVRNHIEQIENPSEIQVRMLSLVNQVEYDQENPLYQELEEIVIDSANLICGTTIGILQYPPIKNMKITASRNSVDETQLFHYLIIDEASKTNFAEFLVPALYAKKWIIVGDPKQLTPYLDAPYFNNLLDFFNTFIGNILIICSELYLHPEKVGLIITESDQDDDQLSEQCKSLSIEFINLHKWNFEKEKEIQNVSQVFGSRLLFGRIEDVMLNQKILPTRIDFFYASKIDLLFNFQDILKIQLYSDYSKVNSIKGKRKVFTKFEKNWQEEVSYRLIRLYELDNSTFQKTDQDEENNSSFLLYRKEIESLMPRFPVFNKELDNKDKSNDNYLDGQKKPINIQIRKILDTLLTLWFPSILEIFLNPKIRNYFSDEPENNLNSELILGLEEKFKENRYKLLNFQNRMEAEISNYPSQVFYNNLALLPDPQLQFRPKINIPQFLSRAEFISIRYQHRNTEENFNMNLDEVLFIINDLDVICDWAKNNPPNIIFNNEKVIFYEIAILTFYKNQEALINEAIRLHFNLKGKSYFKIEDSNVHLIICTSDRFQGHEADIALISLTRTKKLGFLDSKHRINVAVTRAKYYNRIYGDLKLFLRHKKEFPFLYDMISQEKKFYQIRTQLNDIRNDNQEFVEKLNKFIQKKHSILKV